MSTYGQRLKKAIKLRGKTQKWVAEAVGISQQTVQHLCSKGKGSSHTGEIARALDVNERWLATGAGTIEPEPEIAETPAQYAVNKVPLISSVQAGSWKEIVNNFTPDDAEEWCVTTSDLGPHGFALQVVGDSMHNNDHPKSIPPGARVMVNPDLHWQNGDVVVARLNTTIEATVKMLVIDGPNAYLKPLNRDYKTIEINDDCEIVGVVTEWGKKLR